MGLILRGNGKDGFRAVTSNTKGRVLLEGDVKALGTITKRKGEKMVLVGVNNAYLRSLIVSRHLTHK